MQHDYFLGKRSAFFNFMGQYDDGFVLFVECFQKLVYLHNAGVIKVCIGFIKDDDLCIHGQHAGYGKPSFFAAGKCAGGVIGFVFQAGGGKGGVYTLFQFAVF